MKDSDSLSRESLPAVATWRGRLQTCVILLLVASNLLTIGLLLKSWTRSSPSDVYQIPSGIAEELPEMYRDWNERKILDRKTIHVLRDPMCVDIVRDYFGGAYGFVKLDHPVAPMSVPYQDGFSIHDLGELDARALLVIIRKPDLFRLPRCGETPEPD